jgi:small GTP-binding protein
VTESNVINLWDIRTGKLYRKVKESREYIYNETWSPDGRLIASAANDYTIRLWDVETGTLYRILEGHNDWIRNIAWSPDGRLLASMGVDGRTRIWRCDTWEFIKLSGNQPPVLPGYLTVDMSFHNSAAIQSELSHSIKIRAYDLDVDSLLGTKSVASVHFTSVKIVLVGESSVGKSCLALRLAENRYAELGTTHAIRIWPMKPEQLSPESVTPSGERREILLWDLGGQVEYRLIHQLFLHDTTLALVLFDPTRGSRAFEDVQEWNLRLEDQLHGRKTVKLLVGAKLDEESTIIDMMGLEKLLNECGFSGYYPTSAKEERGISALRAAMSAAIDWESLAITIRPVLFQRVRDEIELRRQKGEVALLFSELERIIRAEEPEEFTPKDINAVVEQLALQGVISNTWLASGERVLVLQIGEIERYAGSIIISARNNPRGVPAIEGQMLTSDRLVFPGIKDEERLHPFHERVVLECVMQLLLQHGLCLKHEGLFIFPTMFKEAEMGASVNLTNPISLYYDFSGAIDNIYSSLVVRLAMSERFGRVRLRKDQAEYEQPNEGICGLQRVNYSSGVARLNIYFDDQTTNGVRDLFTVFIEEHLRNEGVHISEIIEATCTCGYRFEAPLLSEYLAAGQPEIICPRPTCKTPNPIRAGANKIRKENPQVENDFQALKSIIAGKSRSTVSMITKSFNSPSSFPITEPIRILHLSDMHITKEDDPIKRLRPLIRDLEDRKGDFGIDSLDYLVVSGDLTDHAEPEEFEIVYKIISGLIERFKLTSERCIIVPGNHDLSWEQAVYDWIPERKTDIKNLNKDLYVKQGNGYLVRNKDYPSRFENYSKFYHSLVQQPYPLQPEEQCLSFLFDDTKIQFLTMNSAWEIDEYYPNRASIHNGALERGITKADEQIRKAKESGRLSEDASVLRFAVWHHPITGNEKITADAFMERLRQEDVKLCLHGHIHEDRADIIGYIHPRKVYVIGAGSFGALAKHRPESMPRLYNLLEIARNNSQIRVSTRCVRKEGGAWTGYAEWPGERVGEKRTYYDISLNE